MEYILFPTQHLGSMCFPCEAPLGLFSHISSFWLPYMASSGLGKVLA